MHQEDYYSKSKGTKQSNMFSTKTGKLTTTTITKNKSTLETFEIPYFIPFYCEDARRAI